MKRILVITVLLLLLLNSTAQNYPGGGSIPSSFSQFYPSTLTDADTLILSHLWDVMPRQAALNRPPYLFYCKTNYNVLPTFYKVLDLTAGDSVNVTTTASYGRYAMFLFRCDNYSGREANAATSLNPLYPISTVVSSSASYMVLAVSMTGQQFHADVTVNGITYSNVPFSPNILVYPEKAYKEYVAFTSQSSEDMMMLSLNRDGSIRQFNDDNDISSNYDWGTEPRITDYPQENRVALMIVFPKNMYTQSATTNVYTRCWVNYGRSVQPQELNDPQANVTYADLVTTDTVSTYNSMAWACGRWLEWVDYVYNQDTTEWAFYDGMLNRLGYTRTGATNTNSDIDVFVGMKSSPYRPAITNMTVKSSCHPYSLGYDWESKLGSNKRFMHNRLYVRSLSGTGFGTVMYYYRKTRQPSELPTFIYENVSFTANEAADIERRAASLSDDDREWFSYQYGRVKEAFDTCYSSTLLVLEENDDYRELLDACLENADLMSLAYQRLDEGDLIPCLLVYDVMQATAPDVLAVSRSQSAAYRHDSDKEYVRNIQSEATACAKLLLSRQSGKENALQALKGNTYSDDESAFSMEVKDKSVMVRFRLDRPARVLLRMDTQHGMPVANAFSRQRLGGGVHQAVLTANRRGTYIVSLLINGQIYSRKIQID